MKSPASICLCLAATLMSARAAMAASSETPAIVVTATRVEARELDTAQHSSAVTATEIRERGMATTPDAIAEEAGVWIQKTNLGGGSPFIRGLTGKQVLILVDGIRFNNSTFRFGPNQYLNTIDPNALGAIEVVRGPGSVMYGSDALGGVVNAITARTGAFGEARTTSIESRLFQQFSSADRGGTTRIETSAGRGALDWSVGASYRHFGDLRAGRGESPVGAVDIGGVQSPTGYDEFNLDGSFRLVLSPNAELRSALLFGVQNDVPRSDKLIASDYVATPELRRDFDQRMFFGYVEYEARQIGPFASLKANISRNSQGESRERRTASWTYTRVEEDEILTLGASVQAALAKAGRHSVVFGAESYFDSIASSREHLLDGGGVVERTGRFPDGTTYDSLGVFLRDEVSLNERLTGALGVRWSSSRVAADFDGLTISGDGTTYGPFDSLGQTYSDVTWSAEAIYSLSSVASVYSNVARGFRAPNVDDLAVEGEWSSGYDIPNPDLDPETCINYEVGIRRERDGLGGYAVKASVFLADYNGLIQRAWLDAGPDAASGTSDDLYRFENVGRARIYGAEVGTEVPLTAHGAGEVSVFGSAAYAMGENLTDDLPVSRIPPLNGRLGVRWELPGRTKWFEVFAEAAARQDRLAASDVNDVRIPDGGTPGWATLNVRGGALLREDLRLNVALYNIADKRYRLHGSGIDAPGLNVVAGLDWTF